MENWVNPYYVGTLIHDISTGKLAIEILRELSANPANMDCIYLQLNGHCGKKFVLSS
jgi:hypothetical protein